MDFFCGGGGGGSGDFVLIEHVTFLFPSATFSQIDENKQDLPEKLAEPFGLSCQFESGRERGLSFYLRGRGFGEGARRRGASRC